MAMRLKAYAKWPWAKGPAPLVYATNVVRLSLCDFRRAPFYPVDLRAEMVYNARPPSAMQYASSIIQEQRRNDKWVVWRSTIYPVDNQPIGS